MGIKIKLFSLLIVSLFSASCAIMPVVESYRDPDVDYSSYKIFSFISFNSDKKDGSTEWSLEEKVIFPIVRNDLEKRGFTFIKEKEKSDFAINVNIVNRYKAEYVPERTAANTTPDTFLLHKRTDDDYHLVILPIRQPVTYGGYTEEYFQIYAELNFHDSKTNKKIWKGSGLYRAYTYDVNIAAPPLISAILDRFRKLPEEKK